MLNNSFAKEQAIPSIAQCSIQNVTQEFLDSIKLPSANGKKLNYLLVVPRYRQDDYAYFFPYGMAMVSSALKVSGRNVRTLNLNYKDNHLDLLHDTIVENDIDVVLCGGLSFQYALLKEIFDTDISELRGVVVNLGNITFSGMAEEISNLDMLPFPDCEGLEFDVLISKKVFTIDYLSEQNEEMRKI